MSFAGMLYALGNLDGWLWNGLISSYHSAERCFQIGCYSCFPEHLNSRWMASRCIPPRLVPVILGTTLQKQVQDGENPTGAHLQKYEIRDAGVTCCQVTEDWWLQSVPTKQWWAWCARPPGVFHPGTSSESCQWQLLEASLRFLLLLCSLSQRLLSHTQRTVYNQFEKHYCVLPSFSPTAGWGCLPG